MIKKFDEFVNEGLISDYKKQKELMNKEISSSEKSFVFDVLKNLGEVGVPYVFTCKNYAVISKTVNEAKVNDLREKLTTYLGLEKDDKNIHITENSILEIIKEDDERIKPDIDYKNVWKSIYKWFEKKYEKNDLKFEGKIKVRNIIDWKRDIKKEVF